MKHSNPFPKDIFRWPIILLTTDLSWTFSENFRMFENSCRWINSKCVQDEGKALQIIIHIFVKHASISVVTFPA